MYKSCTFQHTDAKLPACTDVTTLNLHIHVSRARRTERSFNVNNELLHASQSFNENVSHLDTAESILTCSQFVSSVRILNCYILFYKKYLFIDYTVNID